MAGTDGFIGRTIAGKYEVLARLGAGGMGAVYRARHARTGGDVAVKVLHGATAFDEGVIRRFELEARNAAALRHTNTIRVTDFGVDDGLFYLVMEYLEGRSLAEVLRDDGPLPWRRAVHITRQVLKSLWEAHEHERRIVHRDIKPANIFVMDLPGEPDHVKVLDFGIARSLAGTGAGTQGLIGTPFYMAPELWRGDAIDARTDLYALGCVVFQMLAGVPPFSPPPSAADSVLPLLGMHCHEAPPATAAAAPAVPAGVAAWVDRLLEKNPAARPDSAHAALDALDDAVARATAPDAAALTPAPPPPRGPAGTVVEETRAPVTPPVRSKEPVLDRGDLREPATGPDGTALEGVRAPVTPPFTPPVRSKEPVLDRGDLREPTTGPDGTALEGVRAPDTSPVRSKEPVLDRGEAREPATPTPPPAPPPTPAPASLAHEAGDAPTLLPAAPLLAAPTLVAARRRGRARRWLVGLAALAVAAAVGVGLYFGLGARAGADGPEVLGYLPPSTVGFAVVTSPRHLLDALGYEDVAARLGAQLDPISNETRAEVGFDLLDPGAYTTMGLDFDRPFGVAWVDPAREAFAVFGTVADRARVEAALARVAARAQVPITREGFGEAAVFTLGESDGAAFVLRGDALVLVGAGSSSGGAQRLARRIATQTPEQGLRGDEELAAALDALGGTQDVVAWMNPGMLLGVAPAWLFEGADRPAGPVVLGLVARERTLAITAFVPLPRGALLRRVLRPMTERPTVMAATPERPAVLFAAQFEVAAAVELFERLLRAEGEDLEVGRQRLRDAVGVDLDRDVFGVLSGEVGVAIVGDLEATLRLGTQGVPQQPDLCLVLGIERADTVMATLGKLARPGGMGDVLQADGGGFALNLDPTMRAPIAVREGYLTASTDAGFAGRVAAREPAGGFVATLGDSDLATLFSREGQAAFYLAPQRFASLGWFSMIASCAVSAVAGLPENDPVLAEKARELQQLRAEDEQAMATEEERLAGAARALNAQTGVFALSVEVRNEGLAIHAGQFMDAPLRPTLLALADAMATSARKDEERSVRCQRMWALQAELEAARPRPVEEFPLEEVPPEAVPSGETPPVNAPAVEVPPVEVPGGGP